VTTSVPDYRVEAVWSRRFPSADACLARTASPHATVSWYAGATRRLRLWVNNRLHAFKP